MLLYLICFGSATLSIQKMIIVTKVLCQCRINLLYTFQCSHCFSEQWLPCHCSCVWWSCFCRRITGNPCFWGFRKRPDELQGKTFKQSFFFIPKNIHGRSVPVNFVCIKNISQVKVATYFMSFFIKLTKIYVSGTQSHTSFYFCIET